MRNLIRVLLLTTLSGTAIFVQGAPFSGINSNINLQVTNHTQIDHSALGNIADQKRELAQQIAADYKTIAPTLLEQINRSSLAVSLEKFDGTAFARSATFQAMKSTDQQWIQAKGIEGEVDSILQVRLATERMVDLLELGVPPLIAYEPAGDEKSWQSIEAFDTNGNVHLLSVDEEPNIPVLVVDLDARKELAAGIKLIKSTLANNQSIVTTNQLQIGTFHSDGPEPLEGTQLTKIRLDNDHEPWIKGAAEIYSIVTGIDVTRDQPFIDVKEMPYLDYDDRDYYPGQILIVWNNFVYQATDMILMEHDDGTNYQTIAVNLLNAAKEGFVAGGQPGYAKVAEITATVLEALPGGWFTDDDDFVGVFYTLQKGQSYSNKRDATGDVKATFVPITIEPNPTDPSGGSDGGSNGGSNGGSGTPPPPIDEPPVCQTKSYLPQCSLE